MHCSTVNSLRQSRRLQLFGPKAQNNGQQVASHDDRPNIFQPGQTPILAGQINEYYNFFLPDGISNYACSRSLCGIVVQVLACARLSDNIVRTY